MIKKILVAILVMIILVSLASCYGTAEVNELAYTVLVALDKGKNENIIVTFQIVLPLQMSGGGGGEESQSSSGGSGSEEGGNIKTVTVEAATINSAIEMANVFLSKRITLDHARVVIFGRSLAENGLERYWDEIFLGNQFNADIYVAVCDGEARSFVKNIVPKLESNPAQYIESTINSESTVMTLDNNLFTFFKMAESNTGDAYATFCASSEKEDNVDSGMLENEEIFNETFTAGEIPKEGGPVSEFIGIAAFRGKKYVGSLNASEAWLFMTSLGEYRAKNKIIHDPDNENYYIGSKIELVVKPEIDVDVSEDIPKINVKFVFQADIFSVQHGKDVEMAKIEEEYKKVLEKEFEDLYVKLSRKYQSDIVCFGMKARGKFKTIQEWNDYDWENKYPKAEFNVDVKMTVKRSGMNIHE